ncbi:MAG: regulatory protein RecX [Bacteroidales bacterium]|nr:regulatory protein RecX [Bacteroidales bacterium]
MAKQLNPKTALNRAQWLCSQREKCVSEIKLKLTQWGISEDDSSTIIKSLQKDDFINESRYALTFAHDKARFNKWGPRKIEMSLRAKRIGDDKIQDALSEVEQFTNSETLNDMLNKKAKTLKYKDLYDLKNKLIRFAISRGFDYGKVLEVIDEVIAEYKTQ